METNRYCYWYITQFDLLNKTNELNKTKTERTKQPKLTRNITLVKLTLKENAIEKAMNLFALSQFIWKLIDDKTKLTEILKWSKSSSG